MIVGELINYLRRQLADVNQPYLWSDEELLEYIQKTYREVCILCKDVLPSTIYSLYTVDGVYEYPIDNKYPSIGNVYCDRRALVRIAPEQFLSLNLDVKAKPLGYSFFNKTLYLYPVPDGSYEITLLLFYDPNTVLATDTELDDEWENVLTSGVLHKAYLKDDSETFSQLSVYYEGKFEKDLLRFRNYYLKENQSLLTSRVHRGLL